MVDLPTSVAECLNALRKGHQHYITVKVINGKYYAFEVISKWDTTSKKRKTLTTYLGSIKDNGLFAPAVHRAYARAQEVNKTMQTLGKYDLDILTNLSMNGRMSIPSLAKRLGTSITAARYQIEKIGSKYSLRYMAEIDTGALGYLSYVTFVKFKSKIPSFTEIKEVLENEPRVQIAASLSGEYQLLIYFLSRSNSDIATFIYNLQTNTNFNKYSAEFFTTPDFTSYGFTPIRDKFFELLEEQVWERTKDSPIPRSDQISRRVFNVLKELTSNGSLEFHEIDIKYGYTSGASQYTYHQLIENGTIKRITISITPNNVKYNAIILAKITNGKSFGKTRKNLLKEIISQETEGLINKYVLTSDIETPHGILFVLPIVKESDLHVVQAQLQKQVKGIEQTTIIITEIILGSFCYRRFDNTYSKQYRRLIEEYKVKIPIKTATYM